MLGIVLLVAGCGGDQRPGPTRRADGGYVCRDCNVLFIVSDALRADALRCYGGAAVTPRLDQLARDGVLFERAWAAAPWTLPASVSMFSGRYPDNYFARERQGYPLYYVGDHELLVGEILREAGYEVVHRLENRVPLKTNALQGFEEVPAGRSKRRLVRFGLSGTLGWEDAFPARWATSPPDKFFALQWIVDPHAPYDPPIEFRERIDLTELDLAREPGFYTRLTPYAGEWQIERGGESRTIELELNESENELLRQLYLREVESVDRRIGALLDFLERQRLLETTIVVFTSDHGEEFLDHGGYNHGDTYFEEVLRIPLIIAAPGIPRGQRIDSAVSHIDLVPTLLDLLGLAHSEMVQGKSLAPLMLAPGDRFFDRHLYATGGRGAAVLGQGHKLIRIGRHGGEEALTLYDLESDPGELLDISDSHPELTRALRTWLGEIRRGNLERSRLHRKALDRGLLEAAEEEAVDELKALGYIQ